jgi:hypothetical protein
MSLNPNTRTECVEVLFNPAELSGLNGLCKALGIAKSTFLRGLANQQVNPDGSRPPPHRESRVCRVMRPASRGAGFMQRRQV